ncbi:MAG TPA: hypothetical protein VMC09_05955 [Anaerolineales bacterium]|nr:hypothetical protein [Anaerolineales bacterium]
MNNQTIPSKLLVGAWELVSGSYVGEDHAVTNYTEAAIKSLKVLSEDKFSFITTSQGTFYAAGGGDYTAENGLYVETPALASHPEMIQQRYEFQYQLDGDTWTNSRWQDGIRVEYEVWKRVHSHENQHPGTFS